MQNNSAPPSRRRAKQACDRCRRQKLRCDSSRPCLLCVHSGHQCETSRPPVGISKRTPRKSSRVSAAVGSNRSGDTPGSIHSQDREYPSPNLSTLGFARQAFDEREVGHSLSQAAAPGHMGRKVPEDIPWTFEKCKFPPDALLWAAIDAFFDRVHWFTLVVHEPQFRNTAQRVVALPEWRRTDLSDVLIVAAIAAMGLKAAIPDPSWSGHDILRELNLDGCRLLTEMGIEVRSHLFDLLEDCRIEAVQVCLILSSIHGYHGSSSLAWNIAGMAFRAAIYLELYKRSPENEDPITQQVRFRCWNTIVATDAVYSVIYGRQLSIDDKFAGMHVVSDSEDLHLDPLLQNLPMFEGHHNIDSLVPFYMAKYGLYTIIRKAIADATSIPSTGRSAAVVFENITQAARDSDTLLSQWKIEASDLIDFSQWSSGSRKQRLDESLVNASPKIKRQTEIVILHATILQLLYDSTSIAVHRPLLEFKINNILPTASMVDSVQRSLTVAVEAALRISRISLNRFEHHFAISFVAMHFFTAGVILCLLPLSQPFTQAAQDARSGVVRLIHVCQAFKTKDRMAEHTVDLLTDLLRVTTMREMKMALKIPDERRQTTAPSHQTAAGRASESSQAQVQPTRENANLNNNLTSNLLTPNSYIHHHHAEAPSNLGEDLDQPFMNNQIDNDMAMQTGFSTPSQYSQTLQQVEDAFGVHGQSMFDLLADDQLSAWNIGNLFPTSEYPIEDQSQCL